MMKINRLLLVLAVASIHSPSFASRQEAHGRSIFLPRQLFNTIPLIESGWHWLIHAREKDKHATSLQIIGAYQHSSNDKKVNRYFAPCHTDSLLIAGDDVSNTCARNIRAEWLMNSSPSVGTYATSFSFKPVQKQYGALLHYNQTLKSILKTDFFENAFIEILAPVQKTESRLEIRTGSSEEQATLRATFDNPAWCAGRASCKREHTGLAELRARMGQVFARENIFEFVYYSGVSLPTGHKANSCTWFDATNGFNGCYGINGGVQLQFLLNRNPDTLAWYFFTNVDDVFLIRRHQKRTYDLYDKPWSRFMLYNRIAPHCAASNIPGVNIFTIDSVVRPYNIADFSMGWRFATKSCECEFGYNVWGHGDEVVKIRYPEEFCAEWGIAGSASDKSASKSTIAQQSTDDDTFIPVKVSDLDLYSCATASALTQKIHGAITIRRASEKFAVLLTTGGFYEFAQKNGSFSQWGVWGKLGGSF